MTYHYDIGILNAGVPCTGITYRDKSLGGSESSCIVLAEELAKLGHRVSVFCNADDDTFGTDNIIEFNNVRYLRLPEMWERYNTTWDWDIFLVERDYTKLTAWPLLRSRQLGFLAHDILSNAQDFAEHIYTVDFLYCLSRFHRFQYIHKLDSLKGKINILPNPIDCERLDAVLQKLHCEHKSIKFSTPTFVWNSRPERGLLLLLKFIWPAILREWPESQLYVCYYEVSKEKLPQSICMIHDMCHQLMKSTPHVTYIGSPKKEDLYTLVARSHAVLYPTIFPEVFNINCAEAQYLCTPYLTTDYFAMRDTCFYRSHRIFNFTALNKAFNLTQADVAVTQSLLSGRAQYIIQQCIDQADDMQHAREFVRSTFEKSLVARQFIEHAQERFAVRQKRYGRRIIMNLIKHADFAAARYVAKHCLHDMCLEQQLRGIIDKHCQTFTQSIDETSEYNKRHASERIKLAVQKIQNFVGTKSFTLTDVGSGYAHFLFHALSVFKYQIQFQIVACTDKILSRTAHLLHRRFGVALSGSHMMYGNLMDLTPDPADVVYVDGILEHQDDIVQTLGHIDSWCRPQGLILISVPYGANTTALNITPSRIHHFERRDLEEIFQAHDYTIQLCELQKSSVDLSPTGQWLICVYKHKESQQYYTPNYQRKFETTRPYVKVGLCTIAANEEENIHRFLSPMLDRMDHIVMYVNNSQDRTLRYAQDILQCEAHPENDSCNYADEQHTVIVGTWDDKTGFAGIRNKSLHYLLCKDVDWVLWGDLDEKLMYAQALKKYIHQGDLEVYEGYIIRQQHLMMDVANTVVDVPVRLFRANRNYQWYGLVHEHAMMSINEPIRPTLVLPEVCFLHYGYTTEIERRKRALLRNFPLLVRDRKVNPTRQLGAILYMRDLWHMVLWQLEQSDGVLSQRSKRHCEEIIRMYRSFSSATHQYHFLADVFYQEALKVLGLRQIAAFGKYIPIESAIAMVASSGALTQEYVPQKRWFLHARELETFIFHRTKEMVEELESVVYFFDWR